MNSRSCALDAARRDVDVLALRARRPTSAIVRLVRGQARVVDPHPHRVAALAGDDDVGHARQLARGGPSSGSRRSSRARAGRSCSPDERDPDDRARVGVAAWRRPALRPRRAACRGRAPRGRARRSRPRRRCGSSSNSTVICETCSRLSEVRWRMPSMPISWSSSGCGDRGLDDLRRGAGVDGRDRHDRRVDVGELAVGEARQRDRAEQHDHERHHRREDGPLDRVAGELQCAASAPAASRAAAPALSLRGAGDSRRGHRVGSRVGGHRLHADAGRELVGARDHHDVARLQPAADLDLTVLAGAELDVGGSGFLGTVDAPDEGAVAAVDDRAVRDREHVRRARRAGPPRSRRARGAARGRGSARVPSRAAGGFAGSGSGRRTRSCPGTLDRGRARRGARSGRRCARAAARARAAGTPARGGRSTRPARARTRARSWRRPRPGGCRHSRRRARGCGCARPPRARPRGGRAPLRCAAVTSSSCEGATMPSLERSWVRRWFASARRRAVSASCRRATGSASRSRRRTCPFVTGCPSSNSIAATMPATSERTMTLCSATSWPRSAASSVSVRGVTVTTSTTGGGGPVGAVSPDWLQPQHASNSPETHAAPMHLRSLITSIFSWRHQYRQVDVCHSEG